MTLTQLRHLLAIVDSQMNITVAARRLNSTQPGLSRQLRLLEGELGKPIFERQGRSLQALTELGQSVVQSARTIIGEVASIKAQASTSEILKPNVLRIVTTHTQARLLLPGPLAALKQRYPDLSVQLLPIGAEQAAEMIATDMADLALVSHVGKPTENDICLPLYNWNLIGLLPRGKAIAFSGRAPSIRDLAEIPLVTYDFLLNGEAAFINVFKREGVEPRISVTAREADTVKTYVRSGMGLGILPEFAISNQDDDLEVIDLDGLFPSRITWAIIQRKPNTASYLKDLIHLLSPSTDIAALVRGVDDVIAPLDWRDMKLGL